MSVVNLRNPSDLKIQKLDRRMTGHQFYQYRIEFPYHVFTHINGHENAFRLRGKTFYDFFKHLTEVFGVGPEVEDTAVFSVAYETDPHWAFRMIDNHHTYALYMDEEARIEVEKLLVFMQLQAV